MKYIKSKVLLLLLSMFTHLYAFTDTGGEQEFLKVFIDTPDVLTTYRDLGCQADSSTFNDVHSVNNPIANCPYYFGTHTYIRAQSRYDKTYVYGSCVDSQLTMYVSTYSDMRCTAECNIEVTDGWELHGSYANCEEKIVELGYDASNAICACPDSPDEPSSYHLYVDPLFIPCTDPDIEFPPLPDKHRILFTWSEVDDNSTSKCFENNGTIQTGLKTCIEQYQCIQPTDDCHLEKNEETGSYVSPRDGVFHEDIDIDGAPFELHYQSSDVSLGSVAAGWSLSSHAILKDGTLYRGNGTRLLIDTVQPEGDNSVILVGDVELVFDANNSHIATRDSYTKTVNWTFGYDSAQRVVSISDRLNQTTQVVRDINGTAERIVAPNGQVTLLSVDANNDLLSVTYEDGAAYLFGYNGHLMTTEREPKGNEFVHIFDAQGKIVQVVDAELGEWNFAQANELNATLNSVVRASGDTVLYRNHYLNNGFLRSEKTLPNGDLVVKEAAIDDSETRISRCGVDKVNLYKTVNGVLVKDPVEEKRMLASSSTTMPSGLNKLVDYTTTYMFNYFHPDELRELQTLTTQNPTANSIPSKSTTDYIAHTTTYVSPEGRTVKLTFDPTMQQLLQQETVGLEKTTYSYDTQGRVTQMQQGKRLSTYTYDARGNMDSSTNPKGETTNYVYDARDRLSQIVYPDGHSSAFSYDANSNMTQLTTPTPTDHTFSYNGVNKKSSAQSPLGMSTQYLYDKGRRLTQITRPSGAAVAYTYTNGEIVQTKTPEKTTYYSYACGGKLSSVTNSENEQINYGYDGDLMTLKQYVGELDQSIVYTYNNDFLPSSVTYAGKTEQLLYDNDGLLIKNGSSYIGRSSQTGLPIHVTNGLYSASLTYSAYGEVDSNKIGIGKSTIFQNNIIERTLNGQIKRREEPSDGSIGFGFTPYDYIYDTRERLIEVKKNNNTVEQYTYDANGNRASATLNGQTTTASYTLDDQLEVYGNNTYLYNDDGYLTEKTTPQGTTTYSYGTLGELKEVVTPTDTITYKHNADNQRVAKLKNGVVVEKYLWKDLTTLLAIYDGNDNLLQRFFYAEGRMPIGYEDGIGSVYYIAYDHVGSLRAVADRYGKTRKTISYDSFGNIISDSNPMLRIPFGFAGGLYDPDSKLTRFGYRDYDAYTGKWTAKDPIGFAGGDTNLYGYVLGDPVNFVDPSGLVDVTPLPSGIDPSDVPASVRSWTEPYTVQGTRNINATVRPFGRSNPIPDPENPKDTLPNIEVGICIEISLP